MDRIRLCLLITELRPAGAERCVYELARPLELTDKDSGGQTAPIVYRARQGEVVKIVGGRVVTGWKQVTDPAVLARLDESARGQVWQADLRALGITDFGQMMNPAFAFNSLSPARPSFPIPVRMTPMDLPS